MSKRFKEVMIYTALRHMFSQKHSSDFVSSNGKLLAMPERGEYLPLPCIDTSTPI